MSENEGRWIQLFCRGVDAKGKTCGAYLGALCLDSPHKTRHYCDAKHTGGHRRLEEYTVHEGGHVTAAVIPSTVRKTYYEDPVIVM